MLPADVGQALLVARPVDGIGTVMRAVERRGDHWSTALEAFSAVVGRNGVALPGRKREGDGKTPSGVFPLEQAFGYSARVDTRMAYRRIEKDDIWVDDPRSVDYNRWMKMGQTEAKSFELMWRDDGLYRYGIIIGYNRSPVVGGLGSAIFLHVWKGSDAATSGCIATDENELLRILAWLDPELRPLIVIGHSE